MKTLITYILISLGIFLLFTTCKKYPEGGFTKRGPKLIIGDWHLTLYEVNGIDSTNLINYNGDERYKKVTFYKETTKYSPHLYARAFGATENIINFLTGNTMLSFTTNGAYYGSKGCGGNPVTCFKEIFNPEEKTEIWQIIKLTKKEIILTIAKKKLL